MTPDQLAELAEKIAKVIGCEGDFATIALIEAALSTVHIIPKDKVGEVVYAILEDVLSTDPHPTEVDRGINTFNEVLEGINEK